MISNLLGEMMNENKVDLDRLLKDIKNGDIAVLETDERVSNKYLSIARYLFVDGKIEFVMYTYRFDGFAVGRFGCEHTTEKLIDNFKERGTWSLLKDAKLNRETLCLLFNLEPDVFKDKEYRWLYMSLNLE